MIVPLTARGRTLGALTFVSSDAERSYDEADLLFAEDLARRAALALDNAQHYRQERDVAIALQESLLPDHLPEIPGVECAAKYLSGTVGVDVGGDWYDVISLGDENVVVVMGDVAGRGARAASAMGHLRTAIRAYALEGHTPADVVAKVNAIARTLSNDVLATLVYVMLDGATGNLRLVNAGHPPLLIRRPTGETTFVSCAPGPPVGCQSDACYDEIGETLEPGATLVLYTDGLVERRGEKLDVGLARLREVVAVGPNAPEPLAEHVTQAMLSDMERPDDVAVLVTRIRRSLDEF
jgi:serine phosphatase RsbU (regulator of sigma subunit)